MSGLPEAVAGLSWAEDILPLEDLVPPRLRWVEPVGPSVDHGRRTCAGVFAGDADRQVVRDEAVEVPEGQRRVRE
jgi:hypothetical protein